MVVKVQYESIFTCSCYFLLATWTMINRSVLCHHECFAKFDDFNCCVILLLNRIWYRSIVAVAISKCFLWGIWRFNMFNERKTNMLCWLCFTFKIYNIPKLWTQKKDLTSSYKPTLFNSDIYILFHTWWLVKQQLIIENIVQLKAENFLINVLNRN